MTTIRVAALYWAAIVAIILAAEPAQGALAMSAYGAGLAVNLAVGVLILGWRRPGGRVSIRMLALSASIKHALTAALVLWGGVAIAIGVQGLS